jgi:DGQHR domain-containing protein
MTIDRPALVEVQRGRIMVSTTLTPAQLRMSTKVDAYDPTKGNDPSNGYQRKPSLSRMNQAAEFYGEGVTNRGGKETHDRKGLMPNPIISNIRGSNRGDDDESPSDELPDGVSLTFFSDADRERVFRAVRTEGSTTACATVFLEEDADAVAWIVDGQHREGAVKILSDRKRLSDDFPVPIKFLLGFDLADEIRQFYYINSQAKNVPTDLTAELLQRMARQDNDEKEYLADRKGKSSLLLGAAIYDALVAQNSPWLNRIRKPNEKISKETSIAVSQFINSLKPLQTAQMPRELSPEEWAKIIDAFWEAIARLLPTPFDPTEPPGDWVLFKATGINTMHRVLADCLPIVIQRGARLADPDQYEMLMSDLPTLSGFEIDSDTGEEQDINGSEFWRSASIATQYTGRYGNDRLVGMIRGLITKSSTSVTI